jgi:hypothetical protein
MNPYGGSIVFTATVDGPLTPPSHASHPQRRPGQVHSAARRLLPLMQIIHSVGPAKGTRRPADSSLLRKSSPMSARKSGLSGLPRL